MTALQASPILRCRLWIQVMINNMEDFAKSMANDNSNTHLVRRLFEDFMLLLSLIGDYWKGNYRDVSMRSMLIFSAAVIYILSPIDLIPDFNLGIGQIDDAAVLFFCLNLLEKDLHKYKAWKLQNKNVLKNG